MAVAVAVGRLSHQVARPSTAAAAAARWQARVARPSMEAQVERAPVEPESFPEEGVAVAMGSAPPAKSASPSFKDLNLKISNARTLQSSPRSDRSYRSG